MLKELYIIRHGETDFNKLGIVQGRGVNSDLNETGVQQALRFYEAYNHLSFDKIYTSTLKRTHQTVAPFIENGNKHKWEQLEGLDELNWGIVEGKKNTPELKVLFRHTLTRWANGDLHHKIEAGESPEEVRARQLESLTYILSKQEEKRILICMHGRALRLFLCQLLGKDLCEMDEFPHTNLSLYRLQYNGAGFQLIEFNNTDHLNG